MDQSYIKDGANLEKLVVGRLGLELARVLDGFLEGGGLGDHCCCYEMFLMVFISYS